MTELEILQRRRELVLLSCQMQRATIARRLDHVQRHPVHTAVGLAASVASVPLAIRAATFLVGRVARRRAKRSTTTKRGFSLLALLPLLRLAPALRAAARLRSFNR